MRVKHGSDTYPEIIVKSAGKTQVRYDIEETEFEEMDGTKRTCYDPKAELTAPQALNTKSATTAPISIFAPRSIP